MIKEVRFSTLDSAAVFIKDLIESEKAQIQSVSWDGGRTKIILCFPPSKVSRVMKTLYVSLPYYTPSMVLEAISEPPAFE